jgi:hypothetical protein
MRLLNLSCLFGLSHPIRGGVVLGVEPVAELDRDGDGLFGSEERRVGGDRTEGDSGSRAPVKRVVSK